MCKFHAETISIHAPREGGDLIRDTILSSLVYFNPRPPRGGRRFRFFQPLKLVDFNPRPPRGGRRFMKMGNAAAPSQFQSTPPARGATHPMAANRGAYIFQSTPPARGATPTPFNARGGYTFQSTPPARGATSKQRTAPNCGTISIHAPREGGDAISTDYDVPPMGFQSTPPARGATGFHE